MQYKAFRQQLAKTGARPAYLLIGEEEFLKDRACLEIARAFLGEGFTRDAVRTLYATDTDGPGIVEQCLNLGLFQSRQVLVVKEADALSTKSRKAVLGYLERPSPDTCLVLGSTRLEGKSPFVRDASAKALVVAFDQPEEPELVQWLVSSAKERGREMDRDAAEALISLSGSSLGVLDRELDKIIQFLEGEEKKRIDRAVVKDIAGLSSQVSPDELAMAVSGKDAPESLTLLQKLLDSGEDPVRLATSLFYHLEWLWKIRLAGQARRPQGSIDKRTYWGMRQPEMAALAGKRTDREYLNAMKTLFEAEYGMKSGAGDSRTAVAQMARQLTAKSIKEA